VVRTNRPPLRVDSPLSLRLRLRVCPGPSGVGPFLQVRPPAPGVPLDIAYAVLRAQLAELRSRLYYTRISSYAFECTPRLFHEPGRE
jgi:hypothetical protein